MAFRDIRYYIDPETEMPHIYNHNVSESEVEEALDRPGEDRLGYDSARVAIGQTAAGRYIRVVYVPDVESSRIFVITAYELQGKALRAYRQRRKIK
jgi:hypothetical protein